eukprot:CAMPEP_0201663342 /NCGR_PEP_ID=MMETSP0494-20130426/5174_1 /ASSEMBLY_ACC=CAM_ASM_000839 /TAXON_ID=420259 /ORGANISM="Thalassiosira gravida, Strain GMp14c1" /LENGTH=768 /DNA_ID=CAMNT_0048141915 /DNA_START=141 /DNA_END=2447 /DNA_ORIENTATION=+
MASTTAAMSCPKIMRRPAPALTSAEAVCGTSSAAAAAAASKQKEDAAILQNKGDFTPSTIILEKEEKRDDPRIMIMKPAAAGRQTAAAPTNGASTSETTSSSPGNGAADGAAIPTRNTRQSPWDPLEEVDSALLSALCDARERKALFRLEQVIVDFMKDKSSASMEVGGAFNSIVLNQASGPVRSKSGQTPNGKMSALYQQGLQDLQYQQQRGLRQTSFQRLILHRLADRFNILREQINGNEGRGLVEMGHNHLGQPPSFSPGLIRLVKTNESCVTSRLLIDIDLSLLINYKNPRARNYGGGVNINTNAPNNIASTNNSNYEDGALKSLAENVASTTLESSSIAVTSSSTTTSKKPNKKMVIMKRNSSSGSANPENGKGKQKGKTRRKKLEDREKAYEEARARIFGINGKNDPGGGDGNVEKAERHSVPQSADAQDIVATPLNSCHSSFSVENDAMSPTSSAASAGVTEHIIPSQLLSAAPSADRSYPPSPEPPGGGRESAAASPSGVGSATEVETKRQSSSFSAPAPAAVTSGAVFKAVYRNRQQEENDPDFKRRSDVRPSYVPYAAPPNPYGGQVGYGVGAASMGQQPPPPVPAAMMAMHVQQQQQAAVVHQPHFYPQPSSQFPTPQDAATAAYALNSNVSSNPPPQWAAAPSRGFYPTPQQPEQQEKHPQAWQPRTSPNQMQPNSGSGANSGKNYTSQQFNAPTNNTMNNSHTKQPNKIMWGPGVQGDVSAPDTMTVPRTSAEGAALGEKDGAAVYKPEDFPALG